MKKVAEAFPRVMFAGGLTALLFVECLVVLAQTPKRPGEKVPPSAGTKAEKAIPRFRVSPRPTELSALEGTLSRRGASGDARPLVAPPPLNADARTRLLRESGFEIGPASAPREFRLSPQKPYVSSSAYLFFSSGLEFNAADDSLVMKCVVEGPGIPHIPLWPRGGTTSSAPTHSILGVLIRMDTGSRYFVDFSVSSESSTDYELTITGAEGAGTFRREPGTTHVFAVLESTAGGYARLNFWGRHRPTLAGSTGTFTFHNVVVAKMD
jgi:hypothetical protein